MSIRRITRRNPKTGAQRDFWMVDVVFEHVDGRLERVRKVSPVQTRRGAEQYERKLRDEFLNPSPRREEVDVPTLAAFAPQFIEGYAKANRLKASGILSKEIIIRTHLVPMFGSTKLDQITDFRVSQLKGRLRSKSRKTTNNVLTVLNKLLKVAVKWKVLGAMPCAIELVKVSNASPDFYEFEDYARLVEAATKIGTRELLVVLLGGDAGLRRGEMIGLRWSDVDFRRGHMRIEQAAWKRSRREAQRSNEPEWCVDTPKSGKGRIVPMTKALREALHQHRHLRGERVLTLEDGSPAPGHMLRDWLEAAQRRAGLHVMGKLHKLRHTFCSHLAMRGAPAKAVQELAGHESLTTTLRYMHLSPSARDQAIALLDGRHFYGNLTATERGEVSK
jgi:integrase